MRVTLATTTALLLVGLASPALAQVPTPQPTASGTGAVGADRKDPDKIQCRKQQLPGVLPRYKKVCKTKAEWDAEEKQAEAEMC